MNGKEFDKKETELCIRWKNSYSEDTSDALFLYFIL